MRDWFTRILGTAEDAAELIHRCQRLEVDAGEDHRQRRRRRRFDAFHSGRARRDHDSRRDEGGATRVRSLGRYTTIGEMGLVSQAPRNATIQAEAASVLYVLSDAPIRGSQKRKPAARPEIADLLRFRDGRAADLRQPPGRSAAAIDRAALDRSDDASASEVGSHKGLCSAEPGKNPCHTCVHAGERHA